jgi:hypothetical protein
MYRRNEQLLGEMTVRLCFPWAGRGILSFPSYISFNGFFEMPLYAQRTLRSQVVNAVRVELDFRDIQGRS